MDYIFYGITRNFKTKNYMIVLNNKCKICNIMCKSIYFQQNFKNWTSSNEYIDKFIQDTQLSTHYWPEKAVEWISYNRFTGIKLFGEVYKANWIDGNISFWDNKNQNWIRENQNMFVILKALNNPNDISLEFMKKV